MTGNETIIDLLSRRLEWEEESITINPQTGIETMDYFEVSGIDSVTQETINGFLYVDNEMDNQFDYSKYKKVTAGNEGTFIAVFKNYNREKEVYAATKNKTNDFNTMWDTKVSIYLDSSETIKLRVDEDGINYLEYNNFQMEGYIYNISILEVLKIIKPTGVNLFRDNVRVGLGRNDVSIRLRSNFKDYILSGILENEKICEEYELEETLIEEIIKRRKPELFWYSHNGITIYSKKDKLSQNNLLKRNASIVELNPLNITVINGAQTITNFLRTSEETKTLLMRTNKSINENIATEIVNEVLERLIVKTIIINGTDEYVSDISLGLNTQIPVGNNENVVTMSEVNKINKLLKTTNLKIIRAGEFTDDLCMMPQKLVKMFFVAMGEPGKARNLDTKKLEDYIKEIANELEENVSVAESIKKAVQAEIWWRSNSSYRLMNSGNVENIMKNACYYFCSYYLEYLRINENEGITESASFEKAFLSLREKIDAINSTKEKGKELTSNDFKNNVLYKDILKKLENDKN